MRCSSGTRLATNWGGLFSGVVARPFFNHLIESSSAGFTELILTGERVEGGIKSGKIQKDASASIAIKKTFPAKKEVSAVHTQKKPRENRAPINGGGCDDPKLFKWPTSKQSTKN